MFIYFVQNDTGVTVVYWCLYWHFYTVTILNNYVDYVDIN